MEIKIQLTQMHPAGVDRKQQPEIDRSKQIKFWQISSVMICKSVANEKIQENIIGFKLESGEKTLTDSNHNRLKVSVGNLIKWRCFAISRRTSQFFLQISLRQRHFNLLYSSVIAASHLESSLKCKLQQIQRSSRSLTMVKLPHQI